jgi:hypothetical protein
MPTEKSMIAIAIKRKAKRQPTISNKAARQQQATMGRPRGSKNVMYCHKAGGDRRSIKYEGERMDNKSRKEQKARKDWIDRIASSRQGTGMPKEFVPHPASEELLKKAQELLRSLHAKVPQFTRLHQHGLHLAQRRPYRL